MGTMKLELMSMVWRTLQLTAAIARIRVAMTEQQLL